MSEERARHEPWQPRATLANNGAFTSLSLALILNVVIEGTVHQVLDRAVIITKHCAPSAICHVADIFCEIRSILRNTPARILVLHNNILKLGGVDNDNF